jgi:hypothetical protein
MAARDRALDLGYGIADDEITRSRVTVAHNRRAEHIAILGKTGSGKSHLVRYLAQQDIESGRGFAYFDLHGEATTFLAGVVASHESILDKDLSERLIVVQPADAEASVGLNPLEGHGANDRFVQIAEFSQVLRERWHLDSFGARTDELLRNALYVLAENNFTLLELGSLLAHSGFRATCLKAVANDEVRNYFELRYDQVSEPMRATMREPILNKTSAFTADHHFRHIIGQSRSTFSVLDALDRGLWIIFDLHKGKLGEEAVTLASLFFTVIKNALFARAKRDLFTLYCDEMQNLATYADSMDTVLSESRKFGISVVAANQFLEQYPPEMRAAILAVGTHIFFQLSSADAHQVAAALDSGKPLAELLKNLRRRHLVVKTGNFRWREAIVPTLREPQVDPADLLSRSRARWARPRTEVENEIRQRQRMAVTNVNAIHDWE